MLKSIRKIFGQKTINTLWHLPKNIALSYLFMLPAKNIKTIGITGTDGKTSTCVLVFELLKKAGYKVGLISTIGARIDDNWIETQDHMTVPDPILVQKLLRQMADKKVDFLVLEVTSIALDQHRYEGVVFDSGVFLNISHDHLDYHKNMENYLLAKSKLLKISKHAFANIDDSYFQKLKNIVEKKIVTFGKNKKADYIATNISLTPHSLDFKINEKEFTTDSNYNYQIYNILAAYSLAKQYNISDDIFQKTIQPFPFTKGRREEIPNDFGLRCISDYGHTPQAFENTFSSLKETSKGKLISIFGATGGRDKTKRPLMGKISSQFCDITILTSDDTRNEKLEQINKEITSEIENVKIFKQEGIPTKNQISLYRKESETKPIFIEIDNRQDAITTAVLISKRNDTIVSLGIGHQNSILIGKTEYPWSEVGAFKTAFNYKQKEL